MDSSEWKAAAQERLRGLSKGLREQAAGGLYGALAGATLLPIVTAVGQGDLAAIVTLTTVASGVGCGFIANRLTAWYERSMSIGEVGAELQAKAAADAGVRATLDQLLEAADAVPVVSAGLTPADRTWLRDTLEDERAAFDRPTVAATATNRSQAAVGTGIVQKQITKVRRTGPKVKAEIKVSGNARVGGPVIGVANAPVNVTYAPPDATGPAVEAQRQRYLELVASEAEFLPLLGLDKSTADPTKAGPRLVDVYIGLDTTTTVEQAQPTARKSKRKGRSHAVPPSGLTERGETHPLSALDAFRANRSMLLLGDPGGGKSTFLNHVTYSLARHALDPKADRSSSLAGPLANGEQGDPAPLPVPIVLRELAAWLEGNATAKPKPRKASLLSDYLRVRLAELAVPTLHTSMIEALADGDAVLLLDGLDEVPDAGETGKLVSEMIAALPALYPQLRILVTCRVLSYREGAFTLPAKLYPAFELAPLDRPKIDQFITAWYAQLAAVGQVRAGHGGAEELRGALRKPDLARLAPNPLLLTVMAVVHAHRGRLPEERARLYEDAVELLLWEWDSRKPMTGEAAWRVLLQAAGFSDSDISAQRYYVGESPWAALLRAAGLKDTDIKRALWQLAFEIHDGVRDAKSKEATADIPELKLLALLDRKFVTLGQAWARTMVKQMKLRSGLLVESRPGVYRLPHRTFQEYLAACHLSTLEGRAERFRELARDGGLWRETILLAVGRLVHVMDLHEQALDVVRRLCPEQHEPTEEATWRAAWLAGACLLEMGQQRASGLPDGVPVVARVRNRLVELVEGGRLQPRERAEAGSVLAALGDPRDLEEMVAVPAGKFWMGSDDAIDSVARSARPRHEVELPGFRIARYPVTNEQYARFVAAGQEPPKHWGGPKSPAELRNHPVVNVSWHDAMGYCAWLSQQRGALVQLPTEAEWERAARGTDGRIYPWGDEFDASCCNTYEAEVGATSPVGCFPAGARPSGCLDMAGNVWEWCLSELKDYPYAEDGRNQLDDTSSPRVLRGGAFDVNQEFARCAFRGYDAPDGRSDDVGFRVLSPGL